MTPTESFQRARDLLLSHHGDPDGKIRRVELRKLEAARRERGERGEKEFWLDDESAS